MTMFMIDKRPGVSIDKEEFESRLGGNIGSIETESDEEMDTLLKDSTTKNPFTRLLVFFQVTKHFLFIYCDKCMYVTRTVNTNPALSFECTLVMQ